MKKYTIILGMLVLTLFVSLKGTYAYIQPYDMDMQYTKQHASTFFNEVERFTWQGQDWVKLVTKAPVSFDYVISFEMSDNVLDDDNVSYRHYVTPQEMTVIGGYDPRTIDMATQFDNIMSGAMTMHTYDNGVSMNGEFIVMGGHFYDDELYIGFDSGTYTTGYIDDLIDPTRDAVLQVYTADGMDLSVSMVREEIEKFYQTRFTPLSYTEGYEQGVLDGYDNGRSDGIDYVHNQYVVEDDVNNDGYGDFSYMQGYNSFDEESFKQDVWRSQEFLAKIEDARNEGFADGYESTEAESAILQFGGGFLGSALTFVFALLTNFELFGINGLEVLIGFIVLGASVIALKFIF